MPDERYVSIPKSERVIEDILVPMSLLRAPDQFGQSRDKDCLRGNLIVKDGHPTALIPAPPGPEPRILLPALYEAHCHLDKCHSLSRLDAVGGNLSAALDAQRRDKTHWTAKDLRDRMSLGLTELAAAGCTAVRSHIDWGESAAPPLAWSIVRELAEDRPEIAFQPAALTAISFLADRANCMATAKHIAAKPSGVLGSFVLHHDAADVLAGLANAFSAADRFGLALDFHVDEGLGPYNGLDAICDAALAADFSGPILCGHAVSLIDRTGPDLARLIDKLLRASISICALPTTNLYLQGRTDGTPDRRGITRLCELHAAGVPIVVGSDNVADAFCPMGQHDPRAALHLAALTAHLDPPMGDWLPAITLNPARAMGLDVPYVEGTPLENLRLCRAANTADLVAGRTPLTCLEDAK